MCVDVGFHLNKNELTLQESIVWTLSNMYVCIVDFRVMFNLMKRWSYLSNSEHEKSRVCL